MSCGVALPVSTTFRPLSTTAGAQETIDGLTFVAIKERSVQRSFQPERGVHSVPWAATARHVPFRYVPHTSRSIIHHISLTLPATPRRNMRDAPSMSSVKSTAGIRNGARMPCLNIHWHPACFHAKRAHCCRRYMVSDSEPMAGTVLKPVQSERERVHSRSKRRSFGCTD